MERALHSEPVKQGSDHGDELDCSVNQAGGMNGSAQKPARPAPGEPKPRWQQPWLTWVVLAAMLFGLWLWQTTGAQEAHPEVDYSTAYAWIRDGKVARVVLKGESLDGELSSPTEEGGKTISKFHTMVP